MKISREGFWFILTTILGDRQHVTTDDLSRAADIVDRAQSEVEMPAASAPRSRRKAENGTEEQG